eukprot:SAG11_NODE_7351_length_1157_cov_1.465974_2_plen_137_part_00
MIFPTGKRGQADWAAAINATCIDGDGVVTIDSLSVRPPALLAHPGCALRVVAGTCSLHNGNDSAQSPDSTRLLGFGQLCAGQTCVCAPQDVPRRWASAATQHNLPVNVTGVVGMRHGEAVSDMTAQRITIEALLHS